jgi:mono/diheme cytochrome c family protein
VRSASEEEANDEERVEVQRQASFLCTRRQRGLDRISVGCCLPGARCISGVAHTCAREKQPQAASKGRGEAELIARGKYIVEGLAACGDCHTPRNRDGDIDRTKWLSGAPVFYEPAQRVPGWAISAPRIAGLPPGRDAEIITLLTTATWRDGKAPRPPMPRFHMKREAAEAVVAYLKSL